MYNTCCKLCVCHVACRYVMFVREQEHMARLQQSTSAGTESAVDLVGYVEVRCTSLATICCCSATMQPMQVADTKCLPSCLPASCCLWTFSASFQPLQSEFVRLSAYAAGLPIAFSCIASVCCCRMYPSVGDTAHSSNATTSECIQQWCRVTVLCSSFVGYMHIKTISCSCMSFAPISALRSRLLRPTAFVCLFFVMCIRSCC